MSILQCIGQRLMILSQLLTFLYPAMLAVDPSCNFYQEMNTVSTYYVYNKEYPNNFYTKSDCLWRAVAPAGYKIQITCDIDIQQTPSCFEDQVLISLNGNSNLTNAHSYCGLGSTGQMVTTGNTIAVGLKATGKYAGRFLCTMKAEAATCDCGWTDRRRIVGGVETKINEFPMMAALIDFLDKDVFCGATIIASRYALTAAHCLKQKVPPNVGLLVGDHNISSGAETGAARLHRTINFINHEMYDPNDSTGQNDIAIIQTETQIEYNDLVGPVCLPIRNYDNSFDGKTVDALGWGTTEFTGPKSEVLMKTDLNVLSYQDCYSREGGTILQMCTYKQGHDSCQSDSGGPLLWMDPNSMRLNIVGIISSGVGCAGSHASFNTRVTAYINWIMSKTTGADYCIR